MSTALTYAELPDVDSVRPRTKADDPLFRELAEVLARHNALNRFGVTMLHTHFSIDEGEVLLESTNREAREQIIRPVLVGDAELLGALETSWRLGPNGEILMACHCLMTPDGKEHQGHHST